MLQQEGFFMNKFFKYFFLLLFIVGQAEGFSLTRWWSQDIGLDLGTRNSILVIKQEGKVSILSNVPSAVAYYRNTGNLICFGEEAIRKIGKSPEEVVAVRPLKDGVIYSLKSTRAFIEGMIKSASIKMGRMTKTRMVIGIPCAVKAGDRVAIEKCARQLGATDVLLIKEPIAAAINADLPIGGDEVHMVIDIGGGTTDIIAIAQYGALAQEAPTVAGDAMDKAIVDYIRETFHLSIDEETAQEVKCSIGAIYKVDEDKVRKMEVGGMDLFHQKPRTITVSTNDIVAALKGCAETILNATHSVLRALKDRAAADVSRNGILLVGGGALIPGMKEIMENEFGIKVTIPSDPLLAVAFGIGKVLGDFETYKRVISNAGDDL